MHRAPLPLVAFYIGPATLAWSPTVDVFLLEPFTAAVGCFVDVCGVGLTWPQDRGAGHT